MKQLKCENLTIGYDFKSSVKDLNFEVDSGDYLCIVGANGVGKTTLIKSILGLTPVLNGKIKFLNNFKKSEIGYLPQQTIIQKDFPATVWEVVLSGFQNKSPLRPFYNRKEKERAFEVLKKLGIESIYKKCYRELSGGQQQRVLLARALCATEKMILLDEPISGLDVTAAKEMYALIKKINREGVTIIMITHDISTAMKQASHILFLNENETFFGTKKEFKNSELGEKFNHFVGGCKHE